jgi:small GTP-binding protein
MSKNQDGKIIFTGPVGAGKTTAIVALSDIKPITTDAAASDMTVSKKANTTVAMDYGVMKLNDNSKIRLYGTPGQERFDFMWDILTVGGLGLVLMLDNSNNNPERDLNFFIKSFSDFIKKVPIIVVVTKMDLKDGLSIRDYSQMTNKSLKEHGIRMPCPPVFAIDGRKKEDIKTLVMALLFSIDPGIGG